MAVLETVKTVDQGKGCWLDIRVDTTKADGEFGRYVMESICDGKDGSAVISTPPHWHKLHDEHITALEGSLYVTIEGKTQVVHGGDDTVIIPRNHWHSMESFKGVRTILQERPDPRGKEKALFFNDLLSGGQLPGFWHLMRAAYDGDTYISLPGNMKLVDQTVVSVFGLVAKLFVHPRSQVF